MPRGIGRARGKDLEQRVLDAAGRRRDVEQPGERRCDLGGTHPAVKAPLHHATIGGRFPKADHQQRNVRVAFPRFPVRGRASAFDVVRFHRIEHVARRRG